MNTIIRRDVLVWVAILAFNLLFWGEKMGVNALLFAILILGICWHNYPESRDQPTVRILSGGTLLLAALVVLNNSILSIWLFILSLMAAAAAWQAPFLRFLFFHGLHTVGNFMLSPVHAAQSLLRLWRRNAEERNTLGGVPVFGIVLTGAMVVIFYALYATANAPFAAWTGRFFGHFFRWLNGLVSVDRLFFTILSIGLTGALLWRASLPLLKRWHDSQQDQLTTPEEAGHSVRPFYNTAVLCFGMLNLLLLAVNLTDVQYVWRSGLTGSAVQMKEHVHEGTYVLILTILLAVATLFYFFRDRLHFYKPNHWVHTLAYAWLIQNAFLAFSVGLRNGQYIQQYALGYKRIGVFLFLACTLYGLWAVYQKLRAQKSIYYVFRQTAWAVYAVLGLACLVNWDVFITRYNLRHPSTEYGIDWNFLIDDVSDKNLRVLRAAEANLRAAYPEQTGTWERVAKKEARFWKEQKYSWLSWNVPDAQNRAALAKPQ